MHGTQPLLALAEDTNIHTLDLSGGALKMRPHFHCMVCGSLYFHRSGFLVQR